MNAQRTRRLLLVAFAFSLLIHLLIAAGVRWHAASVEQNYEQVTIVHRLRITHIPPPQHTPPPPRPKIAVAAPKTLAFRPNTKGTERVAVAQPAATPSLAPSPVASPTSNCSLIDTSPAVIAEPPPADIPPDARGDATSGTTRLRVDVDEHGQVTAAVVTASSGNPALDTLAQTLAREAQYSPATHACKAVAGSTEFAARWEPW